MADAPAAPDVQNDDDMPDIPLVGNPEPASNPPADNPPAEPVADEGKDDAATAPSQDGKEPPADPKPATEGEDKPPTAPEGDDKEPPQDPPKDLTPEDRQRLAARAFQQRQQRRGQVAQQIDEHYAPQSEEDLINQGMKPEQAQIEALRQEMTYKEQRTQIAELNAGMQSDAVNVMHDMPLFDPNSKGYDEAFTKQVEQAYKVAARVQSDDNGIILNAEVPLYDFYKQMHDIYSRGSTNGAASQQAATAQMLANTEDPGGSSSVNKGPLTPQDELAEMEARLGDVVITQ